MKNNKIFIVGIGGCAKEISIWAKNANLDLAGYLVNKKFIPKKKIFNNKPVSDINNFNSKQGSILIAVGDPQLRKKISSQLSKNVNYATLVHPTALIGSNVTIKEGTMICPNTILTTNITVGKHSLIDRNSNIGHDCTLGDFFTASPNVIISGNNNIKKCVFFGVGSSTVEKVSINENVIIGANSCVTSNILLPGTYVNTPAKKIK